MGSRIEAQRGLWERADAVDAIERRVDAARGGGGGGLFLIGEAGLGKTVLLERARADGDGFITGFGRGEEMERTVPFGLFFQVLDSLGLDAADVLGGAVEPSVPYLRALKWMRNAATRPVLILLDDLHWADSDSLGLLAFLLRRLRDLPVAVVGTLRPWPPGPFEVARALAADGTAGIETIEPLSPDAARAMWAERSGRDRDGAVLEACGGNPLLIEQAAGGAVEMEGTAGGALRESILLSRFAGLDEASMHLARCAALAGIGFRVDLAIELAELDPGEADLSLDALTLSGLAVAAGEGRMRFSHPLFAQALYEEVTPARRRRLHGRAFRILAERGLDDEATEHAIRAERVGDRYAASVAARAGDAALARGAVETSVRHFQAAVGFTEPNPEPELCLKLATALITAAQLAAADAVCERMLAREDLNCSERTEALALLGQARYLSGNAGQGEAKAAAAVELAAGYSPGRAVKALLDQAVSTWFHGGPAATMPLAERALELASGLSALQRDQAAAYWGEIALELGLDGGYEAALGVGERLASGDDEELLRPIDLIWSGAPAYWYAHCAHYTERFDQALSVLEHAREVLEAAGSANGIAIVTGFIANHIGRRGRLEQALAEVEAVEDFADLTPLPLPFLRMVRAEALLWSGRISESEAECDAVESMGVMNWFAVAWLNYLRGTALLWRGDAAASDHFLQTERTLASVGLVEPRFMPWAGHAIEAHLAAGRRQEAERVLLALEALAPGTHWPRSAAALGRGRLAEADGDGPRAEEAFTRSVELISAVDLPLRRAESCLALGAFLRRQRRLVEARAPLAEATHLAEQFGAGHLAAAAASELRLAGGRRHRSPEDRDRLTPAELRVARLAASGDTNVEIARQLHLSPNTVRSHLKRTYAKLGIRSRRSLAGIDLSGP